MKPPAYLIGEDNVTDMDKYRSEFAAGAEVYRRRRRQVRCGRQSHCIDGAASGNRVVILQFESMDKLKAWWDSSSQKDIRKVGDKYATFAIEGPMPK